MVTQQEGEVTDVLADPAFEVEFRHASVPIPSRADAPLQRLVLKIVEVTLRPVFSGICRAVL